MENSLDLSSLLNTSVHVPETVRTIVHEWKSRLAQALVSPVKDNENDGAIAHTSFHDENDNDSDPAHLPPHQPHTHVWNDNQECTTMTATKSMETQTMESMGLHMPIHIRKKDVSTQSDAFDATSSRQSIGASEDEDEKVMCTTIVAGSKLSYTIWFLV
jgi:hypothetical protein